MSNEQLKNALTKSSGAIILGALLLFGGFTVWVGGRLFDGLQEVVRGIIRRTEENGNDLSVVKTSLVELARSQEKSTSTLESYMAKSNTVPPIVGTQLDELRVRLNALQAQLTTMEGRQNIKSEDMATMRAEITAIRNDLNNLRNEIKHP